MSIVLVWVLVTTPTNGVVTYSPPLVDVADCQELRKQISQLSGTSQYTKCVQIKMVK